MSIYSTKKDDLQVWKKSATFASENDKTNQSYYYLKQVTPHGKNSKGALGQLPQSDTQ